ncbi:MAG: hypothetical protein QG570_599 [Patescibacteria group bacterium]|nr:hypothetical protein [Patescibacteria group bacterium]
MPITVEYLHQEFAHLILAYQGSCTNGLASYNLIMLEEQLEGVIKQVENPLKIISPQEMDSTGSAKWTEYLNSQRLTEAWQPIEGSPYMKFQKTTSIAPIDQVGDMIKPRYSEGEKNSVEGIEQVIKSGLLGEETAVMLDSGGPHSVAMAVRLAERLGYQPIIMFHSPPVTRESNKLEEILATMLYFARQMSSLKETGRQRPHAPPVFVLDSHRNDRLEQLLTRVKPPYTYEEQDFPTAEEFLRLGIKRVVYLNEGNESGKFRQSYQSINRVRNDLQPSVKKWVKAGINTFYTGISPWEHNIEYRINERKGVANSDIRTLNPRLRYANMAPEVYGDGKGISMHKNRQRFIIANKGESIVIDERGFKRDMTPEELTDFRREIKNQIDLQPDNVTLSELYSQIQE